MSAAPGQRTAVLADRHLLWLDSVARVLERAGLRVLLMTCSPAEALARIGDLAPDLLITGITFDEGDGDGLALVRDARDRVGGLRTMVLSHYDDEGHITAAFAAGADAYVLKSTHPDDLVAAVRQAFRHSIFLPQRGWREVERAPRERTGALTKRETEILRLVAHGHSNAQLARMLWVTEQTVKFHLSNVYRKLEVANRTEASACAHQLGLLDEALVG
jgi:DNA-binding NarL/FixJ family response regulator